MKQGGGTTPSMWLPDWIIRGGDADTGSKLERAKRDDIRDTKQIAGTGSNPKDAMGV